MTERIFVERGSVFVTICIVAFALAMAGLRFMLTGINEDFGYGFGVGILIGMPIALLAVGWRRGEFRTGQSAQEVLPPETPQDRMGMSEGRHRYES
jgi:uncharacterized protein YebE (UPF0316 family)